MKANGSVDATTGLHLTMSGGGISDFIPLLQQGVGFKTRVGCSIQDFLTSQLELDPNYIESKITTLFLDGKPVDDMVEAKIKDGSVLALSGAMPGLVGATMRRAGFYASLRSSISYCDAEAIVAVRDGVLIVKLFNVIARDLGAVLLRKGVWLKKADLVDFIRCRPEDFLLRCREAVWNGKTVPFANLSVELDQAGDDPVHFSITLSSED